MNGLWLLQAAQQFQQAQQGLDTPIAQRLMGIVGIAVMLALAWALSLNRRKVNWRLVGIGVTLQLVFGVLVLKTGVGRALFRGANVAFTQLLGFTEQGARFIFGNLVRNNVPVGVAGEPADMAPLADVQLWASTGANVAFTQLLGFTEQGARFIFGNLVRNNVPVGVAGEPADMAPLADVQLWASTGAYFAFSVLPTIIFFSSLMSVLYHLGVMQWIVRGIAWAMQRVMGTSGAETLSVAGNIFVGQTESPLLIKPFVGPMTYSELNTVMVGGFATIAGGVMAAYVGMLSPFFPDIAGHLLTASVMNAPAAIVISKLLVPEVEEPKTRGTLKLTVERADANVIEAAASGAAQGLQLALNVGAMLLAFIALIALVNASIGGVGAWFGAEALSLEFLLGKALQPLAFVMGVPWQDADTVGSLIGVKTVVNEFVAYLQLAGTLDQQVLSPRGAVIATYALLGFANFSSIAIQIGGIGGIAPERRSDLSRLGLRAMIGGNLAAFMSASLAGMLL